MKTPRTLCRGNEAQSEATSDGEQDSTDDITVLVASLPMVKTWRAEGHIQPYAEAKNYWVEQHPVGGAHALSALLRSLEGRSHACIVRGAFVGLEEARKREQLDYEDRTFRRETLFDDHPLHTLLIEVDDFEPQHADPVLDPVAAIEEYIAASLPGEFQCVTYHWQLSNSAGHPAKRHLLKAHLWFWLHTPYTSAQLKAWAKAIALKADHSVFQKIQCHYTGTPLFEPGVVDPVPLRSGFVPGVVDDAVRLDVGAATQDVVEAPRLTRSEKRKRAAHNDPIAQLLAELGRVKGEGADGKLNIECPFAEEHSGPSSDSATSYFPAHTGGFDRGAFKCQHAHCADRPRDAFLLKIGYSEELGAFDALPVKSPQRVRQPRTAHELLRQEFKPLRWVVPKVLPEGVYLLIAAPKIGKSWLALQMVLAVATGTEVLGQPVEPGAALYLALEDNDRRLQSRLRELDAEMLLDDAQGAALQFETQWQRSNEGGAEAIGEWLTAHPDARLVVIDVLEQFRPRRSAKGNLYAEDYAALQALKALADKHRVGIVVVHHTRKGATDDPLAMVSGTQGLAGAADGMLMLERERGKARGRLVVIGRDIEEDGEFIVEFEGCRWTMVGAARAVAKTIERQEILDTLNEAGGPLSAKDVSEVLGKKRTAVARLLAKMSNEGVVTWEDHKFTPLTLTPVTGVTK